MHLDVKAWATTYDAEGEPQLIDVPLTDPPARMESDHQHLVVTSVENLDGSWEHLYVERDTGHYRRMIVRPA